MTGNWLAAAAPMPQQIEAVAVGQAQIEDNEIIIGIFDGPAGGIRGRGNVDDMRLAGQLPHTRRQRLSDRSL